jgi:cytochrome c-type biogenesis protein CcmE
LATTVVLIALALGFAFQGLRESITFFYSPTDLQACTLSPNTTIRLGGVVAEHSVRRAAGQSGATTIFDVTDFQATCQVHYQGDLPDLFREGQGVVVEGRMLKPGEMHAVTVLAKHDETYMPPEVADAIQRAGVWRAGAEPMGQGGQEGVGK